LFVSFWPSLVAGPIKRYRQYVVSLSYGVCNVSSDDVIAGMIRVAIGTGKKFCGDILTGWILTTQPSVRWTIVIAIGFRILLDFSGYSDMAIGFARMMGDPAAGEFQLAIFSLQHHRFLAEMAYLAQHVD
jgi:alginate O-acetyltransferase complex protein AlgI